MTTKKKAVKKPGASRVAAKKTAAALLATIAVPRIGAEHPGQEGRFAGIIRGENGQPDYRLYVPTDKRALLKGAWGPRQVIKGAESEYDGMGNTRAMAAAGSELAKQALALKIGEQGDFYLPSRHEARLLWLNVPELFPKEWCWTSTQGRADSDSAWVQDFGDGGQDYDLKDGEFAVRVVRRVAI